MDSAREKALAGLLPVAGASLVGTGAFALTAGEVGVGALAIAGGIGAALSIAALPVVGIGLVAALVANEEGLGQIEKATDDVSPFLSPGVLGLTPFSPLLSPTKDPFSFARAFGPGVDLAFGVADPKGRVGALIQAGLNTQSWGKDVSTYIHEVSGSAPLSSNGTQSGQTISSGPSPASSGNGGAAGGASEPDGRDFGPFPFGNYAPGEGDTPPATNSAQPEAPMTFQMEIHIEIEFDSPMLGTESPSNPELNGSTTSGNANSAPSEDATTPSTETEAGPASSSAPPGTADDSDSDTDDQDDRGDDSGGNGGGED